MESRTGSGAKNGLQHRTADCLVAELDGHSSVPRPLFAGRGHRQHVAGGRPAGSQSLGCLLSRWHGQNGAAASATKDQTRRLPRADGPNPSDHRELDQGIGQKAEGLSVHEQQSGLSQADQPGLVRPYRQILGRMVGAATRGLQHAFHSAHQAHSHVLGGRKFGRHLQTAGPQVRSLDDGVSGHHAAESGGSKLASCDAARVGGPTDPTEAPLVRPSGKNGASGLGRPTVQNRSMSNFFCQENLTKSLNLLDNTHDTLLSSFMGKFRRLAGAVGIVGALGAAEAAAGEKPTTAETPVPVAATVDNTGAQITDCVAYVRAERDAQKAKGIVMSRKDQKLLLLDCRGGILDKRLAEQKAILAALNTEIAEIDLRLDEQARVIDEQGRVLAQILTINGQLVLQYEQQEKRIEEQLIEAQKIIDQLASS